MKSAEVELVRVGGDVITTSGGPSEVWKNMNKALFWDFADGHLPKLYLYNDDNGDPDTTSLPEGTTYENIASRLFEDRTPIITFMNFENQYLKDSTIKGALLSDLMNEDDVAIDYNGIYTFTTNGGIFTFYSD